jgi:hypothetical protein
MHQLTPCFAARMSRSARAPFRRVVGYQPLTSWPDIRLWKFEDLLNKIAIQLEEDEQYSSSKGQGRCSRDAMLRWSDTHYVKHMLILLDSSNSHLSTQYMRFHVINGITGSEPVTEVCRERISTSGE